MCDMRTANTFRSLLRNVECTVLAAKTRIVPRSVSRAVWSIGLNLALSVPGAWRIWFILGFGIDAIESRPISNTPFLPIPARLSVALVDSFRNHHLETPSLSAETKPASVTPALHERRFRDMLTIQLI